MATFSIFCRGLHTTSASQAEYLSARLRVWKSLIFKFPVSSFECAERFSLVPACACVPPMPDKYIYIMYFLLYNFLLIYPRVNIAISLLIDNTIIGTPCGRAGPQTPVFVWIG